MLVRRGQGEGNQSADVFVDDSEFGPIERQRLSIHRLQTVVANVPLDGLGIVKQTALDHLLFTYITLTMRQQNHLRWQPVPVRYVRHLCKFYEMHCIYLVFVFISALQLQYLTSLLHRSTVPGPWFLV